MSSVSCNMPPDDVKYEHLFAFKLHSRDCTTVCIRSRTWMQPSFVIITRVIHASINDTYEGNGHLF